MCVGGGMKEREGEGGEGRGMPGGYIRGLDVCMCMECRLLSYSVLTTDPKLEPCNFQEKKTEKRVKGSKKQKKDPNAPKKPLTAYMVWLGESRPALKAKYPGLSITDLSKKAGELWKTLDDKSVSKLSPNFQWLIGFMFTYWSNTGSGEGLGTRLHNIPSEL